MYLKYVIDAVNRANEIKHVRILYVCQTSNVGQSYPMSIGNAQHIMHMAAVTVSQTTVLNILFLEIAFCLFIFFLRNPKIKSMIANKLTIIVTDDRKMSQSCVLLILYDCVRLPSNMLLMFLTRAILVLAPLVSRQRAVRSFGSIVTLVEKFGLPPECSIIVLSAFTDHPAA